MKDKKIHVKLEQLINSLTINENQKTYLRARTSDLYDDLTYICQRQQPYWLASFTSTPEYQYALEWFWYGGSFDRGIFIKNRFDIDMYLVYRQTQSHHVAAHNIFYRNDYQNMQRNLTGGFLFELLHSDLKAYQSYRRDMKILKRPPYGHAIPIRMDYHNVSILFDCIPAIEEPNGYLIIPSGMGGTKKVSPNLEEQFLSKLNKEQDGRITKLILLIKYWNFNWGKPLKGYVIERLVEHIFDKIEVHTWERAVRTFFNQAIHILKRKISLPDRVYPQYSILDEHSSDELKYYLKALREADSHAHKGEWKKLFNDI